MKIALINSSLKITGSGRYAFSLYKELKKEIDTNHIFLNYKERKIKKIYNNYEQSIFK